MPGVTYLWPDPVFRQSVRRLVSLEASALELLRELTETNFDSSAATAAAFGLKEQDVSLMLGALEVIYTAARDEGDAEAVYDELKGLLASTREGLTGLDLEDKRSVLLDLLQPRPDFDDQRRYRTVQRSVLPVLEDAKLTLDIRISEEQDQLEYTPVILARFGFDEYIQTGENVSFQLTDEAMDELESELAKIRRLRQRLGSGPFNLEGLPSD